MDFVRMIAYSMNMMKLLFSRESVQEPLPACGFPPAQHIRAKDDLITKENRYDEIIDCGR